MKLPYASFVFDLDGTLVDSIPGIDCAARTALAEIVPGEEMPSLRPFIGPPIRVMLKRALDWADAPTIEALEKSFRNHYDKDYWRQTCPYPGVDRALRQLKARGCRLHILTNKPVQPAKRIAEHLGWSGLMDAIVSPQSRTPPYPDKASAAVDLKTARGLKNNRTLLIGDSLDDEVAAQAAGFNFAAASWGYGEAAIRNPRNAIDSISDIINL